MLITILCRVIALSTDATRREERFSAAYFALYMFVFLFTELFVNDRAAELLGPAIKMPAASREATASAVHSGTADGSPVRPTGRSTMKLVVALAPMSSRSTARIR